MRFISMMFFATLVGCSTPPAEAPPAPVAPVAPVVVVQPTTAPVVVTPAPAPDPSVSIQLGASGGSIETKNADGSVSIGVDTTGTALDPKKKK